MKQRRKTLPCFVKYCKYCPPLHYLLCTQPREYKAYKTIAGFIYGIILGFAFYELILVDLNFTENAALLVGGTICLMLAFGLAFSSQIRCITLLSFPCLAGKAGRGVLKALVIAYIISGPVENLSSNGKEVVRVFSCTASLTFNLTKTRFELMFKPFTEALFGMKTETNEIKDTLRSIKDVSAPITGELEDDSEMRKLKEENDYLDEQTGDTKRSAKYETKGEQVEAARYEREYLKKIELRCENQFTKASKRCRQMFASGYNKCYETVTFLAGWLLCWPMKLDFVCNIAEALGGSARCDPSHEISSGFGAGYAYLRHSGENFASNFKNVRLQYKIGTFKQLEDVRDARDTATAVLHEMNRKKAVFDKLLTILTRLLALLFLTVLVKSQTYHDRYLRDIQFDNVYITKYFRRIDARRRKQEKHTLLPLKKVEKRKLVDERSALPLKKEFDYIFKETIILLLEMVTATIFILLDRLLYESLDIVRRHARIDYHQVGKHDMKLEIKGTGMIASLLRSVVRGFNIKKRINLRRSNVECLPKPSLLLNYYLYKIYGTYFVIWVMIIVQAYTQRCQHLICAYFYRKQEKKRVLFLYNETLKRRMGFARFMRKKITKLVRQHRLDENYNIFTILRIRYPNYCSWLKMFACVRRKCLICGDREPYKNSDYRECGNANCHFTYCLECWIDVGKVCLVCEQETVDTSSGIDESTSGDESTATD